MSLSPQFHYVPLLLSAIFALVVIGIRLKAANRPTNARKIIIPPLGMSTGFLMFVVPVTRVPIWWGLLAFVVGAIFFAYPLIRTSQFTVSEGQIYLKRSKAFAFILLILLAVRLILHNYVEQLVTLEQTAALFFLLAFGMLLPWRLVMLFRFKKIQQPLLQDRNVNASE